MANYKNAYFTKSFMVIGNSLKNCFHCSYCRVIDNSSNHYSDVLPTDLNEDFTNIPVAVNLFYGDPFLQTDNTYKLLRRLEDAGHKGPVVIITKGLIPEDFPKFNLDIHFGLSTFGVDSKYDGGSLKTFFKNLETCSKLPYKFNIEFRPIIKNINDSKECFELVTDAAAKYNVPIAYCGLQLSEELASYLETHENIKFEAYDGVELSMKKYLPNEVHEALREIANRKGVHIFKKTSCLIAYMHDKERDYNAHYYRPNEVGCYNCPMMEKCFSFKDSNHSVNIEIPFEYTIEYKTSHICTLFKKGICKFPSNDCKNIKGKVIKINEKLTTSDVRLIKWLTGFTVDANFTEEPFISDKWIKR